MARSPLTEKFLRIVALRDEVKTWPQDEQDFFLDMLAPEPVKSQGRATKRAGKKSASKTSIPLCGACGYAESSIVHKDESRSNFHLFYPPSKSASKSSRASSLAEQIKSGRIVAIDMASKEPICSTCGNVEDFEDHFKPSPHYHEFDAGKSLASPAPRAGAKSSTNGGAIVTTANSEDETVSAGAVAGGSNE